MEKTVILGTDLMLFKGEDKTPLACATSCKLTISAGTLETSSKDSGKWTSKQAGKLSWNASSDNLFTLSDYKELVSAMVAREKIEIEFATVKYADSDNGVPTEGWQSNNDGYKGFAIITSIDMTANDGENATYSVSLEGCGALTPTTTD